MIDLTPLMDALVTAMAAAITAFIVPSLKNHLSSQRMEELEKWVRLAVAAAEQLFSAPGSGGSKYDYVQKFIGNSGYKIDEGRLKTLIESAVYDIGAPADGHETIGGAR